MNVRINKSLKHREEIDEDRLSFLPNHVKHYILSFLSIKDIAMLSLASKKYEKLCSTIPFLTIDDTKISIGKGSVERDKFMDFLGTLMKRRQGEKMTDLSIGWSVDDLVHKETNRIFWLLNSAMECHVNNISLKLDFLDGEFTIPLEMFWTKSLRSLKVSLAHGQLDFPSPNGFSHLKHLHLEAAKVSNDSLGEWISSVCKYLEVLWLICVFGMKKFKLSSRSLREIHIMKCDLDYLDISAESLKTINFRAPFYRSSISSLNIYAPNLLILRLSEICFESLSVEKSELGLSVGLGLPNPCPIRSDEFKRLLSSIGQATEFDIDYFSIQVLYENGCLPLALNNLQSLSLRQHFRRNITILAACCFLQGLSRNLKKLRLYLGPHIHAFWDIGRGISPDETFGYNLKFWESLDFSFIHGLEELDIEICGGEIEEGLVEYLLANAKMLNKLTISSKDFMPTKLADKIDALLTNRAEFSSRGNKMVVEFKPQLGPLAFSEN